MFTPGGQLDRLTFAGVRGGGGKGSAPPNQIMPTPPPPTYSDPITGRTYKTPEELNVGIGEREKTAKEQSDAKIAADALEKTTKHNTWLGTRDTAVANERTKLEQAYRDAGVDPAAYKADIDRAISEGTGRIVDDDPNVASVFAPNLGESIVASSTGARRTGAEADYNKIFDPNYATSHLATSNIDPYVASTIAGQFDPLGEQLNNARLRGTLSDPGYTAATNLLGTKRTAGTAAVRSLGSNIINEDVKGLNDYITGGRNTASNLKLNEAFDPTTYQKGAETRTADYLGSLGGDIANAVGGAKYADINELMNAGGAVQGGTNPNLAPKDTSLGANILADDKKRGLGSTGAF